MKGKNIKTKQGRRQARATEEAGEGNREEMQHGKKNEREEAKQNQGE